MHTFDEDSAGSNAAFGEPELSTEAIARALAKLGFTFDPTTEEGQLRAAEFVNEALSDPAKTDRIVTALDADQPLAPHGAPDEAPGYLLQPFIPQERQGERTPADDFLMDDAPTRGKLLTALEAAASRESLQVASDVFISHTANDYLLVQFLSTALKQLPPTRISFWDRLLVLFNPEYPLSSPVCAFTHYFAPHSARLAIKFRETDIHLKYWANHGANHDAFVVARERDGADYWWLEVRPAEGDAAKFSRQFLDGFEGDTDQARVALDSLRSAVEERARAHV